MMSEGESDEIRWSDFCMGDLVRNLEEGKEAGEKRRSYFRNKLELLKERQEVLQQRRLDRLYDEGIVIDMDSVRKKLRESRHSMWRERKEGSEMGEDPHGSMEEWDEYDENDLDIGRQSRGTKSLIHMDSSASLHRQSRLGKIQEEIEGVPVRRKPDSSKPRHPALQRAETKPSIVRSLQTSEQPDQSNGGQEDQGSANASAHRKLHNLNNVVKAVGAFRSSAGLSPRTWKGAGKQNYLYPGMNADGTSRPGSGSTSPNRAVPMSKESKARHLFSYSGFNKK